MVQGLPCWPDVTNVVKSFCLHPVTVKQDGFIEDHSENDGGH